MNNTFRLRVLSHLPKVTEPLSSRTKTRTSDSGYGVISTVIRCNLIHQASGNVPASVIYKTRCFSLGCPSQSPRGLEKLQVPMPLPDQLNQEGCGMEGRDL